MVVVTPRSSKRTNVIHARAIEGSVRNYSKQKTIADVHFHYPNKCLSDRTQTATAAAAEVSSQKNRKPSRIIETRLDKSTQKSAKVITHYIRIRDHSSITSEFFLAFLGPPTHLRQHK